MQMYANVMMRCSCSHFLVRFHDCFPIQEFYAAHVAKNGVYLGELDLALLAGREGPPIYPTLAYWDSDGLQIRPLSTMLADFLGLGMREKLELGNMETYVMLKCRADLVPGSVTELNHYIPVWHEKQLGQERFVLCQKIIEADVAVRKLAINEKLVEVSRAHGDPEWADAALAGLLMDEKHLESEEKLNQELFMNGLVPFQVPGDGNCLLWSWLALEHGPDCILDGKNYSRSISDSKMLREDCHVFLSHSITVPPSPHFIMHNYVVIVPCIPIYIHILHYIAMYFLI